MSGARRAPLRRSVNVWRRLDAISRHAWPAMVMFLGLLVIGLPFGVPGQAALRPAYAMACVFFWSLYRPASLPAPVVAGTGLLLDLLGMSPMGMWAVLLLVLQGSALAWLLQSLLELSMLPAGPEVVVCLAAAGLYPALAAIFVRAHRGAAAAELA